MNSRFSQRFEEGMYKRKESLGKKKGVKSSRKYGAVSAGLKPNTQAHTNITSWHRRLMIRGL